MYTTAARIGGALDKIPSDRVTDGIDQLSLFMNGEGHSRRDYMVHYSGGDVGAVRIGDYKAVMGGGVGGGLPQFETYNILRDPGEKYGALYGGLFAVTPIQMTMRRHMGRIKQFPHRKPDAPKEAQLTPHD